MDGLLLNGQVHLWWEGKSLLPQVWSWISTKQVRAISIEKHQEGMCECVCVLCKHKKIGWFAVFYIVACTWQSEKHGARCWTLGRTGSTKFALHCIENFWKTLKTLGRTGSAAEPPSGTDVNRTPSASTLTKSRLPFQDLHFCFMNQSQGRRFEQSPCNQGSKAEGW